MRACDPNSRKDQRRRRRSGIGNEVDFILSFYRLLFYISNSLSLHFFGFFFLFNGVYSTIENKEVQTSIELSPSAIFFYYSLLLLKNKVMKDEKEEVEGKKCDGLVSIVKLLEILGVPVRKRK